MVDPKIEVLNSAATDLSESGLELDDSTREQVDSNLELDVPTIKQVSHNLEVEATNFEDDCNLQLEKVDLNL